MELSSFATLADAKAYEQKTYRKLGGNESRQFFSLTGVLDALEAQQTSTIATEVI